MNIIFIGDIVGRAGRDAVSRSLNEIRENYKPDVIIANAENAASGYGLNSKIATEFFKQKFADFQLESSVYDIAASYGVLHVIKPDDTRDWLIRMLQVHRNRLSRGLGQHLLSNWPTTF